MKELESNTNYLVYLHKDSNGDVRYIGHGKLRRAYKNHANSSRGQLYANFVENTGKLDVEIVKSDLSLSEAIELEVLLFEKYNSKFLLNIKKPSKGTKKIEKEILSKVRYSEDSPSCLIWAVNIGKKIKKGTFAGSKKKTRYYAVGINRLDYYCHRLVYALHNPEVDISLLVVDHIDGNSFNNKISNLRAVPQAVNCRNRLKRKRPNPDLPTGISWNNEYEFFVIQLTDPSKVNEKGESAQIRKTLLVRDFESKESALQEAIILRETMLTELNNRLNLGYINFKKESNAL